MYNYHHISYDPDWYKDAADRFFAEQKKTRKTGKSSVLAEQGFRYTSRHGRTKIEPLVFASGHGPFLKDIDDNIFLDFGSGTYVTNLGHAHPKVSEAISIEAKNLMNCHDHMTPVKAAYYDNLVRACGGKFTNIHLYDNGTTAVEFAIKAAREITGKYEIISCFSDHHGKTMGSASLGRLSGANKAIIRAPGFFMVPRPDPYRPIWKKHDGSIDLDAYLDFYELFIRESTSGQVAAFVLEPIQGWGGTIVPPDDYFPKLQKFCKAKDILLIADEILTGCGRTGKWFCMDHWQVVPDITLLGKGIGNGFPMSAMLAKSEYSDAILRLNPSTTFGGNPMACGAGLATLEIFEDDSITENSENMGKYLLQGLNHLKEKYDIIGDVRGKGCILGMEFVRDRDTKEPFNEVGDRFYLECLRRKLIPGIPVNNLVRIAPPLIVDKELVDMALSIFDESLACCRL